MQYNDTPNWGIYTSSKYNECLSVDNYTFYKISTEDEDSITWRCSKRKCYATVHTNASASVLSTTINNVHAHPPRPSTFLDSKHANPSNEKLLTILTRGRPIWWFWRWQVFLRSSKKRKWSTSGGVLGSPDGRHVAVNVYPGAERKQSNFWRRS